VDRVTAGETYCATLGLKWAGTGATPFVAIQPSTSTVPIWIIGSEGYSDAWGPVLPVTPSANWQQLGVTVTMPADTTQARFAVELFGGSGGANEASFDGFSLTSGACAQACDVDNGGCDPLTVCTNLPEGRSCGPCPTGYSGTGETGCIDINECDVDNGGCDPLTVCTNLPGSRTCGVCPAGYEGAGETGCIDINECDVDNGGCDPLTVCANLPGGRTCGACPRGYEGTGEAGCIDIDECAVNNGGCDLLTVCTDLLGGHTCGPCPAGYDGTGATGCTDVNECATNNGGCDVLTACTNLPGTRSCGTCPSGYTGTGETGCIDIDECLAAPCQHGGTCTNSVGTYVCACLEGWIGTNCETSVPVQLLSVGDVGDCNAAATAAATSLLADQYPGTIAVLGDTDQMTGGTLAEYLSCFDVPWGRHKARLRPVPGNHDYMGVGPAGYFEYYGAVAGTPRQLGYQRGGNRWRPPERGLLRLHVGRRPVRGHRSLLVHDEEAVFGNDGWREKRRDGRKPLGLDLG
jgi:hypothetical protein